MTCGNDRNEESRKAIMNRPGPPMATANAWIHASTVFIRTNLRLAQSSIHAPDMTEPPVEIIAEPPRSPLALRIGTLAAVWGILAAIVYFRAGLTLSHYDARGHLVVARRVIDNLTPGWLQIGAVWLPLPHLLNMLPVQVDVLYRTGASGVAISIASF